MKIFIFIFSLFTFVNANFSTMPLPSVGKKWVVSNTGTSSESCSALANGSYTSLNYHPRYYYNIGTCASSNDYTSTSWKDYVEVDINIPNNFECTNTSTASICSGLSDGNLTYLSSYGNSGDTACVSDGHLEFEITNDDDPNNDYYGCFVSTATTKRYSNMKSDSAKEVLSHMFDRFVD